MKSTKTKVKVYDKNVKSESLTDYAVMAMVRYGRATLDERAIPTLRDGLRPVQKRILWVMHKFGLTPDSKPIKSAKVIGEVMAKLHPHGDVGLYKSMVNMAHLAEPLVHGKGNWGSFRSPAAAHRYTEAKLTKYAHRNFFSYKDSMVDFVDNYDATLREPLQLPSNTLNLLVNGSEGIAMAINTCIPTFTLESVNKLLIKAFKLRKEGKEITNKTIAKTLKFKMHYGGVFLETAENREAFMELIKNGRGSLRMAPTYEIKDRTIFITGFTKFQSNYDAMIVKLGSDPVVADIYNATKKETGPRIGIVIKKSIKVSDREKAFDKIIKKFSETKPFYINYCTKSVKYKKNEEKITIKFFVNTPIKDLIYAWIDDREYVETEHLKQIGRDYDRRIMSMSLEKWAHDNRDLVDRVRDEKQLGGWLAEQKQFRKWIKEFKQESNAGEHTDFILGLTVKKLSKIAKKDIESQIRELQEKREELIENMKDGNYKRDLIIERLGKML